MVRWFVSVPILLVVCAAISGPAQAADPAPRVMIYGVGASSCGTWLADRQAQRHQFDLSWILGFLSASGSFAALAGGHLSETDANAVAAWVDKYCRDNPLKNIADASGNLFVELAKPE